MPKVEEFHLILPYDTCPKDCPVAKTRAAEAKKKPDFMGETAGIVVCSSIEGLPSKSREMRIIFSSSIFSKKEVICPSPPQTST